MQLLLEAAIAEIEHWQSSSAARNLPVHRVANLRDKLLALRRIGSVDLLRNGVAHVFYAIDLLEIPVAESIPSLSRLATLLQERN